MDLNFDGLMIETHPNPNSALSDANQQITPETLSIILESITIRNVNPNNVKLETLENLRHKIDKIDNKILDLLQERMQLSTEIGKYKKRNNMTILQQNRWNDILQKAKQKGQKHKLNANFIAKLYKEIHQESINKQTKIMNKNDE